MSRRRVSVLPPSPSGSQWSLATHGKACELCPIDAAPACIVDELRQHIGPGTDLVLIAPSTWWQVFHLSYPKLSKSKAAKALAFDAEPLCPIPIDRLAFADPCGQEPGKSTLLVGLDMEVARPLVSGLVEAGYGVLGIAPLAVVIADCVNARGPECMTVSVASQGRIDTVAFAGRSPQSWRTTADTKIVEVADSYVARVETPQDASSETMTEVTSVSSVELCASAATCCVLIPGDWVAGRLAPGTALLRWSTPAAIVGICLLLASFGLFRRAAQLEAAIESESALQRAQYVSLHPQSPVPTVILDRLSSELRSVTLPAAESAAMQGSVLKKYRETLLRVPPDAAASIERIRFDGASTTLTGTAASHAIADQIGYAVSPSAVVKTSSTTGGKVQYEIRVDERVKP